MGRNDDVMGAGRVNGRVTQPRASCQPTSPQLLRFQGFTRILERGRAGPLPRNDSPMTTRSRAAIAVLLVCLVAGLPAQTRTYPVDDLKPGMVAIGRTVFEGDRLDEFKAHIL